MIDMTQVVVSTSANRRFIIPFFDDRFIGWLLDKEIQPSEQDIDPILIKFLEDEHKELFYLDGEVIEEVEYTLDPNFYERFDLKYSAKKYNL